MPLASFRCFNRFDDERLNQKVEITTLKIRVYKRGPEQRRVLPLDDAEEGNNQMRGKFIHFPEYFNTDEILLQMITGAIIPPRLVFDNNFSGVNRDKT